MAREKSLNPAQAQHKRDKANAIKKAKAERSQRITEKLSKRNPDRISRQIETLKEIEQEGRLQGSDRKLLADLEQQLVLVNKAREKVQQAGANKGENLAKDGDTRSSGLRERHQNKSGVYVLKGLERKSIYWDPVFNPTGLPPEGFPYQEWSDGEKENDFVLDEEVEYRPELGEADATGIPLPKGPALRFQQPTPEAAPSKTTYEAAPIVRDLKKESASFIPTSVQRMRQHKRSASAEPQEPDNGKKMRQILIEDADDPDPDEEL
ncbi:WW domain binding protein 11-domain-containing protein [Lipomyces kononenkoae]|uniref:WW domain binding protein 11-domain-containing protein n=1 Tax=Lipomyces kononenkoae TaxID=34357 RepID=A0ACC3SUU8_LIPKO